MPGKKTEFGLLGRHDVNFSNFTTLTTVQSANFSRKKHMTDDVDGIKEKSQWIVASACISVVVYSQQKTLDHASFTVLPFALFFCTLKFLTRFVLPFL